MFYFEFYEISKNTFLQNISGQLLLNYCNFLKFHKFVGGASNILVSNTDGMVAFEILAFLHR